MQKRKEVMSNNSWIWVVIVIRIAKSNDLKCYIFSGQFFIKSTIRVFARKRTRRSMNVVVILVVMSYFVAANLSFEAKSCCQIIRDLCYCLVLSFFMVSRFFNQKYAAFFKALTVTRLSHPIRWTSRMLFLCWWKSKQILSEENEEWSPCVSSMVYSS